MTPYVIKHEAQIILKCFHLSKRKVKNLFSNNVKIE
jgi:hypothetical protein